MLIVSFCCGAFSSPWVASKKIRNSVGPVNAFLMAAIVGGACFYNPAAMPYTVVSWPTSVVYSLCLGVMLTTYLKSISVFHWTHAPVPYHPDMPVRMAYVSTFGGMVAGACVIVTAILIESKDFGLTISVVGTVMIIGGIMIGAARYLRGYKKFFIAL
jgi:hypothetical protein